MGKRLTTNVSITGATPLCGPAQTGDFVLGQSQHTQLQCYHMYHQFTAVKLGARELKSFL